MNHFNSKYLLATLIILTLSDFIVAQNFKWSKIEIHSNANYNSTFLTNNFATNFVTGKYINSSIKNNVTDRLKDNENLLGANLNYGFLLSFKYVNSNKLTLNNTLFKIGLNNRNLFYSTLSKDLIGLVLNGNTSYLGNEMHLGTSKFNYLNFKELKFEVEKYNNDSSVSLNAGVNLLAGNSFAKANIGDTRMLTSADISSTTVKLDYDALMSDTAKHAKKTYAINGLGASFNFELKGYVHRKYLEKVTLSIADLGFINWNSKTIHLYQDTSIYFQGIEIKNVNQLKDTNNALINNDSLKALVVKSEKIKQTI